ncbi:MAG: photosynthetic complex putative assembly protein PuhB [Pseudomonadota bacterium]
MNDDSIEIDDIVKEPGQLTEEPVKGLPENLPQGEQILWQGIPKWQHLAISTFHIRKIMFYFLIVATVKAGVSLMEGAGMSVIMSDTYYLFSYALLAVAIFSLIAWLIERTTVYTITSHRIVLRFGVALPMAVNIPFERIMLASMRCFKDGSGDIPISVDNKHRFSYLVMYPHIRPWHMLRPQPMLRGLDNVEQVAEILADALANENTLTNSTINIDDSLDNHLDNIGNSHVVA